MGAALARCPQRGSPLSSHPSVGHERAGVFQVVYKEVEKSPPLGLGPLSFPPFRAGTCPLTATSPESKCKPRPRPPLPILFSSPGPWAVLSK